MTQNRFWNLLAKKMADEATEAEIRELEELMRLNPDWHYAAQHIQDIWGLTFKEDSLISADSFLQHLERMKRLGLVKDSTEDAHIDVHLNDPQEGSNASPGKKMLVVLSMLGLVAVIATVFFFHSGQTYRSPAAVKSNEISTRPGSRTKLKLPDGTAVWLNAGSKLTYDHNFGINTRDVVLVGEAYFEVVRMPELPFVIQTPSMQVKVLGTSFNVKSYPDEPTSETSVIKGSVEIIPNQRPGAKFVLKPNEKLIVSNAKVDQPSKQMHQKAPLIMLSSLTYAHNDSSVVETSWVENRLVFDDEPFSSVALKLEKWYGVKIVFNDKQIGDDHLTGSFEHETLQQALDAIQLLIEFHYEISQNIVTIHR